MKARSPQRTPRLSSDGVRLSAALKLGISFLLTCLALVQFTRALLQPPNELPQEPATKSLQPRLISHGKPAWMQSLRIWSESSTAGSRRGPVGTVQVQQVFKPLESANTATAAAAVHLGGLQLGPGGHVKVPFRTGHTGYQRPSGERTVSRRQMELPAVTGEASELEPAQQEQQIDAGRAARLADKSHKQGQQIIKSTKQQQGSRAQVEHEQQAEQQAGQEPRLLRQRQQQQQQRIPGQETLLEDQMPIAESEGQATPQQALYVGHADAASTSDALRVASGDTQQDGLHFSLYILEGNTVLRQIPHLAHVQCDIHSPLVWPHVMRGRGVDSSHSTPHWAYQHAVQWWVTQALRNSTSIRLVDSMDEADLVYVDLYCLSMWWYSFHNPRGERNQPPPTDYKVSVVRHIQQLERFRRKQGADFVFLESHPGLVNVPGTPPFDQQAMCTGLHRSFWLVSESASVCRENHQEPGPHLLLPYNTVTHLHLERPLKRSSKSIFLFYRGGCAPGPPDPALAPQYSSGKLLRAAVVEGIRALPQALTGLGNRTRVECSCDICPGHLSHQKTLQQLASSLFCPVIPGDTQSSRRVSEVILSGCIPVFLGPPFHTLPLADAVNYTAFSVFIRLNETSQWIFERRSSQGVINDRQRVENLWRPDVDLEGAAHSVPSVADAYRYLQSIPPADIDRMLAALGRERLKLLYSPPPGGQTSQLAELLVARLARHAQAVQQLQPVQEASEDATQRAAAMLRASRGPKVAPSGALLVQWRSMELASLDPKDYVYAKPSAEQVLEQQRLLACCLGWAQPSPSEALFPVGDPPVWREAGGHRSDANGASSEPSAAALQSRSAVGLYEARESCQDLDAVMLDLFGTEAETEPTPISQSKQDYEASELMEVSDTSDTTQHPGSEEEDHDVDLLFSNTGIWRDWDLHSPAQPGSPGSPGSTEATSPGTFLKLNHEATALAINCSLRKWA